MLFWAIMGISFSVLRDHERTYNPDCICKLMVYGTQPCKPAYGGGVGILCPCHCHGPIDEKFVWSHHNMCTPRYAIKSEKTGYYD